MTDHEIDSEERPEETRIPPVENRISVNEEDGQILDRSTGGPTPVQMTQATKHVAEQFVKALEKAEAAAARAEEAANRAAEGASATANLKEGDLDPSLGKRIQVLILRKRDCIVYLDETSSVKWWSAPEKDPLAGIARAEIANRIVRLEAESGRLLASGDLPAFRRMLGEAMATMYKGQTIEAARAFLDRAEDSLKARSNERARIWYLSSTAAAAGIAVLCMGAAWILRSKLGNVGTSDTFELVVFSQLGSVGALLSVLRRSRDLPIDAAAGRRAHHLEGVARVALGICGAFLVSVAVKANLLLGLVTSDQDEARRLAIMATIAIVAGASERLVPNLIQRLEAEG